MSTEEKVGNFFGVFGFLMVVFFAAAMDSECQIVPAAGLLIGCLLMVGGSKCSSWQK